MATYYPYWKTVFAMKKISASKSQRSGAIINLQFDKLRGDAKKQ